MKHRVSMINEATGKGECSLCGIHDGMRQVKKGTKKDPERMVWICPRRQRKYRVNKKSPKTILKEKTQRRFNKMVVNHYKKCLLSHLGGCSSGLQCHHLKRVQSNPNLRFTFENCVCLCAKHHMFAHDNPDIEYLEVERWSPGKWDRLTELARTITKVDPADVLAELQKMEAAA